MRVFIFLRCPPLAVLWVAGDESLWSGKGRPPKELYDVLVCLAVCRYFGGSLRGSMGLLRLLRKLGAIDAAIPCFKTLDNYQRSSAIEPCLSGLIRLTSNPLKLLEHFYCYGFYRCLDNLLLIMVRHTHPQKEREAKASQGYT